MLAIAAGVGSTFSLVSLGVCLLEKYMYMTCSTVLVCEMQLADIVVLENCPE